jgi:hypothetical protein
MYKYTYTRERQGGIVATLEITDRNGFVTMRITEMRGWHSTSAIITQGYADVDRLVHWLSEWQDKEEGTQ